MFVVIKADEEISGVVFMLKAGYFQMAYFLEIIQDMVRSNLVLINRTRPISPGKSPEKKWDNFSLSHTR
jgi:hypothetical protein